METVKTRFAPSPTGFLHIGGARTAVFNWAFARKEKGIFLLRIEDTDRERSRPLFEEAVLEDLRWLGIDWNEGPYRQSERFGLYQSFFADLQNRNLVYPCYCTPQELEAEREKALAQGKPPRYSGKCFFATSEDRARWEKEGRLPSWRFRIPAGGVVRFHDLIRGEMHFSCASLGDFIIIKSDGVPTYNFACVIDDALMGISHVLRGEEHLSNTPYQILLYQALGFSLPCFAHLPIILDEDRTKLSKRRGDVSLRSFREEGLLPQALLHYLFTLGHSFAEEKELFTISELIDSFAIERIGKAGAVFDEARLWSMNGTYIRGLPSEELLLAGKEFSREFGKDWNETKEKIVPLIPLAQEEATNLREFVTILREIYRGPDTVSLNGEQEKVCHFLHGLSFEAIDWDDQETIKKKLRAWQKASGVPPALFYRTLRMILIGREEGPELHRLLWALGKDEVMRRIHKTL